MAQPAIGHSTITVLTTPMLIFEAPTNYGRVNVYVGNEGASKVFLGDQTVTVTGDTEGYNLPNAGTLSLELNGGEQLWAVSGASSKVCLLWTL